MGKLRPRGGRSQLKVTEESEAEPQSLDSCTRVLKYVLKSEGLGGRECLLHWSFKKKDCCSASPATPALQADSFLLSLWEAQSLPEPFLIWGRPLPPEPPRTLPPAGTLKGQGLALIT